MSLIYAKFVPLVQLFKGSAGPPDDSALHNHYPSSILCQQLPRSVLTYFIPAWLGALSLMVFDSLKRVKQNDRNINRNGMQCTSYEEGMESV
jgi:hypothetical protein